MIKPLLATAAVLALLPGLALAENAPAKTAPKAAVKSKAAKGATPQAANKTVVAKAAPTARRTPAQATAAAATAAAATGAATARTGLGPEELDIAKRVYVGEMACELGASVRVAADAQEPGHFHLEGKGFKFHMAPVTTSTGAVRLEDHKAGAVWLQIANKSMLMDQKRGQRLADECKGPEQVAVAEAQKKAPPQNLLDAPSPK